ncbi:hypothetical protein [Olivibacter sitiensis]|uniref:hypothetical protein n=1 Tax=Olivibacter sitiensis TaxID=376470 RepID=UPI000416C2C8|nr:hypothetical protein [Olivibacter sitiensis]
MKKTLKLLGCGAVLSVFLYNMSVSKENSIGDIDLSSLTKINEANAECISNSMNNGHCYELTNNCYWGLNFLPPCDAWAM